MPGRRFAIRFARSGPPPEGEFEPPIDGDAPPPPEAELEPPPPPPPVPLRPVPPQRERRDLARRREIEIRDVGGLAVEMARREDWRYPLLHSRCAEVLTLEARIHELDAMIAATQMAARGVGVEPCQCGAPILRGSHFCSNCGRPAPETPPVVMCSHCGQPLQAEANFCPVCGNAVAAEAFELGDGVTDDFGDTLVESPREGASGGT
jgi:Double zinc ribbon